MRVGIYALLAVSACGGAVLAPPMLAQSPAQTQPSSGSTPDQSPTQPDAQAPPNPVDQRDKEIREVDPLDREQKDKKSKTNRKDADEETPPLPGSIAASEQSTQQALGPQVEDEEGPVQEYSGPAVLSRSYSINQALIPEEIKWNESAGFNFNYDSGLTHTVEANGSFGPLSPLYGSQLTWSFSGKHYFRRDSVSVAYTGNWSQYSGYGAYSGMNQMVNASYQHVLSRRLFLNIGGAGSILSQNSILQNQPAGPESVANINISTSPNIQIYDTGAKQFTTSASLTWQQSVRLSFNAGVSYFGLEQDDPLLLGVTGMQARGDVNYRTTRKTTIGAYYSFSHYLYPHGFGNSETGTFGGIYSYAITRTMQIRFRGGISDVDAVGLVTVTIPPPIASLLGVSTGIIDSWTTYRTSDVSGQFVKDFRHGRTASIAYARGITPGNGVYQTSQQETITGSFSMKVLRVYALSLTVGRDTLESVGLTVVENLGKYQSEYAGLTLHRTYGRGVGANLSVQYRHFDIDAPGYVQNQLAITSGVTWGSGTGRLWPF